jgi:laminin gamma 1
MPDMMENTYSFRLHENPKFNWNPRLSAKDFIAILANITSIKVRGTYGGEGQGFLDEVKLGSAERGGTGPSATWIERCNCSTGYQGQFCQLCQEGYHHENNGGPFARCIPCSCNGHTEVCDTESGKFNNKSIN